MTLTLRERLLRCFRALFPAESDKTLLHASPESVEQWDSSNHYVMLSLVEEEFDVRIPDRIGQELLSFADVEEYLKSQLPAS